MPTSEERRAEVFEEHLVATWNLGRDVLNGYARDTSDPLPPMPEFADLPDEAQVAFALQATEILVNLTGVVDHIATVLAQRE